LSQQQPSEEELRAALEEEMRRLTPEDVIVQSVVTLVNLAGRKLGLASQQGPGDEKDLGQAHTAIEAVRALLPLVPEEPAAPIREALSQLQMAYVRERESGSAQSAEPQTAGSQDVPQEGAGAPPDDADEAERAKARAKIWTPPGS
jgi:hypothetical protein